MKKKKVSFSKGQHEICFSFAPVCSILIHVKKTALPGPVCDTKIDPDFLRIPQQFRGDLSAIILPRFFSNVQCIWCNSVSLLLRLNQGLSRSFSCWRRCLPLIQQKQPFPPRLSQLDQSAAVGKDFLFC